MIPGDTPDTITVQVRGFAGQAAAGHRVGWSTPDVQAVVTPLDTMSDAKGFARAVFSPGPRLGEQSVSATVGMLAPLRVPIAVTSGVWNAVTGSADRSCGIGPSGTLSCVERHGGSITRHTVGPLAYTDITADESGLFCAARATGVDCFRWVGPAGTPPPTPQSVAGIFTTFVSIASEDGVFCGVDVAAAAWCWGNNQFGRLGTGDETPSLAAVRVLPGMTFVEITVTYTHACGLTTGGEVWCWGNNVEGQLGLPADYVRVRPPQKIDGLPPSSGHASSAYATCAVGVDRIVRCWGLDAFGALGRGGRSGPPWTDHVPAPIARIGAARAVTGTRHGFAVIDYSGRVHAWGRIPSSSGVFVGAPILLVDASTTQFVTHNADWMACARQAAPSDGVLCVNTAVSMTAHLFGSVPPTEIRAFHGLPPSP